MLTCLADQNEIPNHTFKWAGVSYKYNNGVYFKMDKILKQGENFGELALIS